MAGLHHRAKSGFQFEMGRTLQKKRPHIYNKLQNQFKKKKKALRKGKREFISDKQELNH